MKRQPHIRLFRLGNDGLQKIGDVRPHLVERVRSLIREWGKVLHSVVVHPGQSGAAPAHLLVVAFHGAVGVEVVLHNGQTNFARGLDRLPHLFDLFISTGFAIERLRKPGDHQIAQRNPALLELVDHWLKLADSPWNRWTTRQYVIDAELHNTANRFVGDAVVKIDGRSDLGSVRTFLRHSIAEPPGLLLLLRKSSPWRECGRKSSGSEQAYKTPTRHHRSRHGTPSPNVMEPRLRILPQADSSRPGNETRRGTSASPI